MTSWAWGEQKRPKTQRPLFTPSEVSFTSNICFYWFRVHMNIKVEQYRGHGNGSMCMYCSTLMTLRTWEEHNFAVASGTLKQTKYGSGPSCFQEDTPKKQNLFTDLGSTAIWPKTGLYLNGFKRKKNPKWVDPFFHLYFLLGHCNA